MSDSLMEIPLNSSDSTHNYYQLVENAVFQNNTGSAEGESAAYLTSMTKAYMKDGNMDHALSFFEGGFQKRVKQRKAQEEFLVNLYDSTLGGDNQ
jgi:hypothetical protein